MQIKYLFTIKAIKRYGYMLNGENEVFLDTFMLFYYPIKLYYPCFLIVSKMGPMNVSYQALVASHLKM